MKKIFLESHNIKNPYFGFGQFNYHLIKELGKIEQDDFRFIIHGSNLSYLRKEFGESFGYRKYFSFRRYSPLRIREKYDLWHSLNQNTKFEPFHDINYLLTVHNITNIKDKSNYMHEKHHQRFQEKLKRSAAITYISNYAKSSTHEFFEVPDVPEFVIYNGNPIKDITISDDFKPSHPLKKPYLFSIGEFTERKNFKSLIPMLENLPELNLVLAGKDSTPNAAEIRSLIKKRGLKDRIFLIGKISEQEKQYHYQNCKAFVFPSLREGFGLPIIEAMRFGKPVFASRNTSLPEIGGDLSNYWDHYDGKYMAEVYKKGIEEFEKNESEIRPKLISRANTFDWKTAAMQYLEVYKTLF